MDADKMKRRSSGILKAQKPRNPFTEVHLTEPATDTIKSRRVSFAANNFVKPFFSDPDKLVVWDTTYEEEMNHTDSTSQSSRENITTKSLDMSVSSAVLYEDSEEIVYKKPALKQIPKIYVAENESGNRQPQQLVNSIRTLIDKENLNPIINDISIVTSAEPCFDNNVKFELNLNDTVGDKDCDFGKIFSQKRKNSEPELLFDFQTEKTCHKQKKSNFDLTLSLNETKESISKIELESKTATSAEEPVANVKDEFFGGIHKKITENKGAKFKIYSNLDSPDNAIKLDMKFDLNETENENTLNFKEIFQNKTRTKNHDEHDQIEEKFPTEVKLDNNGKTIHYNNTVGDMNFTVCQEQQKLNVAVKRMTEVMPEVTPLQKNRKTVVFNNSEGNMDLSTVVEPSVILENTFDEEPHSDSIKIPDTNVKLDNNRKTIVFGNSVGDVDFTTCVGQQKPSDTVKTITNTKEAKNNFATEMKLDSRKTVVFNNSMGNMDFTTCVDQQKPSDTVKTITNTNETKDNFATEMKLDSRKTVVFNNSVGDMDFTTCLGQQTPSDTIKTITNTNKTKEKFATETKLNSRKTVVFNNSVGDMDFTTCLGQQTPSETIKTVTNTNETIENCTTEMKLNNRKTIVFNNSVGDMDFTTCLGQQTPIDTMKTITNTNETKENYATEMKLDNNRKTMVFNNSMGDMDFTTCLGQVTRGDTIKTIQETNLMKENFGSEAKLDNNRKTLYSVADMDFTIYTKEQVSSETTKTITERSQISENFSTEAKLDNNRKTMHYNNTVGDMDFTTCLGEPTSSDTIKTIPQTISMKENLVTEGKLDNNRKTMVFNNSMGDMDFTTCLGQDTRGDKIKTMPETNSMKDKFAPEVKLDNNRKTLHSVADMDFTIYPKQQISSESTKTMTERSQIKEKFSTEATLDNNRKTMHYNKTVGDMDFTTCLGEPTSIDTIKTIPQTISMKENLVTEGKLDNNRKTMVFNNSMGDMDFTTCLGQDTRGDKIKTMPETNSMEDKFGPEVKLDNNRKTLHSVADMDFTIYPKQQLSSESTKTMTERSQIKENFSTEPILGNNRKTVHYNNTVGDMDFTTCLGGSTSSDTIKTIPQTISIKENLVMERKLDNSRKTMVFNNSMGDMDFTTCLGQVTRGDTIKIIPETNSMKENFGTGVELDNNRKTPHYNNTVGDMDISSCPEQSTPSDTIKIVPENNSIKENFVKLDNNRKTIHYNNSVTDMDFSICPKQQMLCETSITIPQTNPIKENFATEMKLDNNRKNIHCNNFTIYSDQQLSDKTTKTITEINEVKENFSTEMKLDSNRKTIHHNNTVGDMDFTVCQAQQKLNGVGEKMTHVTEVTSKSLSQNNRKTVVFNNSEGNMELTTAEEPSIILEKTFDEKSSENTLDFSGIFPIKVTSDVKEKLNNEDEIKCRYEDEKYEEINMKQNLDSCQISSSAHLMKNSLKNIKLDNTKTMIFSSTETGDMDLTIGSKLVFRCENDKTIDQDQEGNVTLFNKTKDLGITLNFNTTQEPSLFGKTFLIKNTQSDETLNCTEISNEALTKHEPSGDNDVKVQYENDGCQEKNVEQNSLQSSSDEIRENLLNGDLDKVKKSLVFSTDEGDMETTFEGKFEQVNQGNYEDGTNSAKKIDDSDNVKIQYENDEYQKKYIETNLHCSENSSLNHFKENFTAKVKLDDSNQEGIASDKISKMDYEPIIVDVEEKFASQIVSDCDGKSNVINNTIGKKENITWDEKLPNNQSTCKPAIDASHISVIDNSIDKLNEPKRNNIEKTRKRHSLEETSEVAHKKANLSKPTQDDDVFFKSNISDESLLQDQETQLIDNSCSSSPTDSGTVNQNHVPQNENITSDKKEMNNRLTSIFENVKRNLVDYEIKEFAWTAQIESIKRKNEKFERELLELQEKINSCEIIDVESVLMKEREREAAQLKSQVPSANVEVEQFTPKGLIETIQDMNQSNQYRWRLECYNEDTIQFSILNKSLKIYVSLSDFSDIQTNINLAANSDPICHLVLDSIKEQLRSTTVTAVLGSKFDLLSLLNYINKLTTEHFMVYIDLEKMTWKNLLDVDYSNNRCTFQVLNSKHLIWWVISVDISNLQDIDPDKITAINKGRNSSVNEKVLRDLSLGCSKGLNFFVDYLKKINHELILK
ncbi:uncharacterized protein LOC109595828 [Aethina tumida]|uniref:uncharacterized protein LOC109595828 n=1 Tax=Aethina tumida TaxID=116153 RepID=UPI002147F486|nr:uncharacterized protein LOC109595828 [Aethina tumida]